MTTPPNSSNAPDLPGIPGHSTAERRAILAGLGGLAAGAFLAGRAQAGPLNPPAGPVASTGKTLTDVEPRIAINATNTPGDADSVFRISQPGSYYLTENLTGVSGRRGIEIASDGVTIDLNGFALLGVGGSLEGIQAVTPIRSVTIRNGTIRGWGGHGIDLFQNNAVQGTIEHVHASGNLGTGIRVGSSMTILHCTSTSNSNAGFSMVGAATISHSTAANNLTNGIALGTGGVATNCTSTSNTLSGFTGSGGSVFTNCTARSNRTNGFDIGNSSVITRCTAIVNDVNGIRANSGCVVLENNCDSNGLANDGAGILASGVDNRIERNHCTIGLRGIDVNGTGNLIIGNTCRSNSINYDIVANNRYGPIVNIPASGTAAVLGSSAASTLTTTEPHANFSM